jgi:hypothetical protein
VNDTQRLAAIIADGEDGENYHVVNVTNFERERKDGEKRMLLPRLPSPRLSLSHFLQPSTTAGRVREGQMNPTKCKKPHILRGFDGLQDLGNRCSIP